MDTHQQGYPDERDRITIVIITRNRCDSLARTLEYVSRIPGVLETIVVDNATEGSCVVNLCQRYDTVQLISLEQNQGPAARNVGVNAARTPYVAFCDDDSWWEPASIGRAIAYFEQYPGVALLAGTVLIGPDHRLDPVSALQSSSPLRSMIPMPGPAILGFLACSAIVRVDAFGHVGGYPSILGVGGEEELLAIDLTAAGWGLSYASDIIAHHYPSPHRSLALRKRNQTCNALWIAWMRRPWRSALRISMAELRRGWRDRAGVHALVDAAKGLPRALRHRRVIPCWLEAELSLLERSNDRS